MLTIDLNGSPVELPLRWLRDSCPCPECVHPSGQRTVDPAMVGRAEVRTWASSSAVLRVVWEPDGHVSDYSIAALTAPRPSPSRQPWDASSAVVTTASASELDDPAALERWLAGVERYGFGVLTGVPNDDGEVARVAERFSFVRMTNYGRFFDVRSVVDPTNLAYTSLGLAPHTDNPYRDPVPTMQLLHCLAATTSGGDNSLVDGFAVADRIRRDDVEAFAALCATDVEFRYADADTELVARAPVIEIDATFAVKGVRFNPRSIQPPPLGSPMLDAWYRGYIEFARLVNDEAFQVQFHLEPGELFIVDNRRVLHGRTGFDTTAGTRHLQGCYADIDGLRSTLAVLRRRGDPVDRIVELFHRRGDEAYLGERVSMSQHMIQSALEAEAAGAPDAAVAAALLHDIGHLVHDLGDDAAQRGIDARHEDLGAAWLEPYFGPKVTEPVRLHVAAKRYLCTVEPTYFATLSPASVETYHLQGGAMSPEEVAAFEDNAGWQDAVAVRRWDDSGKDATRDTPPIERFVPLLRRLLA